MTLNNWISVVIAYGLVACVLFTGLIAVQFVVGGEQSLRDENGRVRKQEQWNASALVMLLMAVALFIGVPVVANSLVSQGGASSIPNFWIYLITAYSIAFLVNLYDLVVIDYLVILRWRPAFLHLPDTLYYTTLRPHVEGWKRGLLIVLILSFISALISLALHG
ncbi:hypothetical protein QPK87_22705 [Kamptonema cortianum]|jgi:hypothetical protein|nr:hypothetical protein [Geitlerinema splendidum]MDK3159362.1 hypothetical protein [Kamptonema cortianum]